MPCWPRGTGAFICPSCLVVPLAALTASAFGWLLGATSIRLKGDYLAIVTLAFAQIFRLMLLNLDRPINITGGPNGIPDLDFAKIAGYNPPFCLPILLSHHDRGRIGDPDFHCD